MAVAIDILAMVATAAAATNVRLIMAQSLLILMPNDTTTKADQALSHHSRQIRLVRGPFVILRF